MSNALTVFTAIISAASGGAATNPASQPSVLDEHPSGFMLTLLAVGICIVLMLLIRWISQPRRFTLRHTPGRPNSLNPAHVLIPLAAWFLSQIAISGVLFQMYGQSRDILKDPRISLVITMVAQAVWVGASIAVAVFTFRLGLARGLGLSGRHWIYDSIRAVLAYLAVLPLCLGTLAITNLMLPAKFQAIHPFLMAIPTLTIPWKVVLFFSAVVMAPLSEEIFFRGLFQSLLRRHFGRPWLAIIVSAVLFGTIHFETLQDVPALVVLGVALGYNYEKTGRLFAPILIHALFNAASLTEVLLQA